MSLWRFALSMTLVLPVPLAAQAPAAPKSVTAVRVDGSSPRIDGRLDEAEWATATPATGFILREPTEGAPAPEATEVRFLYTHDALYVGARMRSNSPSSIRRLVGRRLLDRLSILHHQVVRRARCHARRRASSNVRSAGPTFDASLALEFLGFGGPELEEGHKALKEKRAASFPPKSPY